MRSGLAGELAQVVVAVESAAVAVAEHETQGVVADNFPAEDLYARKGLGPVAAVLVAEDIAFAEVGGAGDAARSFSNS
jgi:hypothetical protein